jgi:hypothetical protein
MSPLLQEKRVKQMKKRRWQAALVGMHRVAAAALQATGPHCQNPWWHNNGRHIAAVQRIFATAQANGIVACHHGAGPGISAQFVRMDSQLCQIGNVMWMLTTATAEALKACRDALP